MKCQVTLVVAAALLVLTSLAGCIRHDVKVDEGQFDQAIDRIDRLTGAVDKAVSEITKESASWRKALADLEQKIRDDGQDLLANEVHNTLTAFTVDIGDELRASADYIEAKLKDNLKAFRLALERARAKVIEAKGTKDSNGIKVALDELANVKVFPDPVVIKFIPEDVELDWKDASQSTGYTVRNPLMKVRGWGFERPEEELRLVGRQV